MKIVLVNPPQIFYPKSAIAIAGFPLGLMYIGAILDTHAYKVELLNAVSGDHRLRAGKDGTIQYGMTQQQIREELIRRKPDVVGVSNPFTAQLDNAVGVCEIVKDIDAGIPVIIGGPHASVRPIQLLEENDCIDFAVMGEGEYTILDLIKHLEGKKSINIVEGMAYRENGKVKVNPKRNFIMNLDELPYPSYSLVNMEEYLNLKKINYRRASRQSRKELPMITSRGCPYNCIFCAIHLHMGKIWRPHSANYVIQHVEHVVNKYGVNHIHFEDDNLTMNPQRFESILDGLIEKRVKFTWDTPNGIRADSLSPQLIKKMQRAGCESLTVSAESGDQQILDKVIDKHLSLQKVVEVAGMCKDSNLKLNCYLVVGLPGEKLSNVKKTVNFAWMLKSRYNVTTAIQCATPFYGTRLHQICLENGYLTQQLTPRALSESPQFDGKGLIKTEDFTPETLKKYIAELQIAQHVKSPLVSVKIIVEKAEKIVEDPKLPIELLRNRVMRRKKVNVVSK